MQTSHWTWLCPEIRAQREAAVGEPVGKGQHIINNFCIALASNEPRCTSCHAGYGWEDRAFDFEDETQVDCLVCHDNTGEYRKFPTGAGHPNYEPREWPAGSGNVWEPLDLSHIARNVGKPTRENCGACHFWGGGGEGVKHGDLDATLIAPGRELDVHMDTHGLDFRCTECHTTIDHLVAGRCFTIPAVERREYVIRGLETNLLACESCHGESPHLASKLNDHTDKVACQACHIPTMARERPTKVWWDWSTAGEMSSSGAPIVRGDSLEGLNVTTYDSRKGEFIWALNANPQYVWFNGNVEHTFIGDPVDDVTPAGEEECIGCESQSPPHRLDLARPLVSINKLVGSYDDPTSRIWPVKIHRGRQPYDSVSNALVIPKLFGPRGSGAYWADYDWETAIRVGMEYSELEYSGAFDFIQTEMFWPLSHMVAPAENAIGCAECHTAEGRLAELAGFYMPGRDRSPLVDGFGFFVLAAVLLGVGAHGGIRYVGAKRQTRPKRTGVES